MTILETCEVVGNLVVATGDGTDPVGAGLSLIEPPAWVIGNLGPLWVPGNVRGADVPMPGSGVRPYRRWPAATNHSLSIVVSGDYDYIDSNPCPDDPWVALERNLLYLSENVIAFPGTRPGTRDSILTMASGTLRYASPHYLRIVPATIEQAVLVGTLEISIPDDGYFTLDGESPSP